MEITRPYAIYAKTMLRITWLCYLDKYQNNEKKAAKLFTKKAKDNINKSKIHSHAPQLHTHKHAHTITRTHMFHLHTFA